MDICSFVFLSLGPVRPRGGGIYSIIEDVVCQAYFKKTGLEPTNCGYMQFCLGVVHILRNHGWGAGGYAKMITILHRGGVVSRDPQK